MAITLEQASQAMVDICHQVKIVHGLDLYSWKSVRHDDGINMVKSFEFKAPEKVATGQAAIVSSDPVDAISQIKQHKADAEQAIQATLQRFMDSTTMAPKSVKFTLDENTGLADTQRRFKIGNVTLTAQL